MILKPAKIRQMKFRDHCNRVPRASTEDTVSGLQIRKQVFEPLEGKGTVPHDHIFAAGAPPCVPRVYLVRHRFTDGGFVPFVYHRTFPLRKVSSE